MTRDDSTRRPFGIDDDAGFEAIGIRDDLMFKEVFGKDAKLAGRLLELVLSEPVGEVEFVHAEHEVRPNRDVHATTFDVYLRTKAGVLGDLEMQTSHKSELPLRLRAHLSNMEREAIAKGTAYLDACQTVSVFICTFDPMDRGLTRYTVRRMIKETGEIFPDRQTGILINAGGPGNDVPDDLAQFLRYVMGYDDDDEDAFVRDVDESVRRTRADWDWRRDYMTLQEKLDDARAEGLEQGIELGIEQGHDETMVDTLSRIMEAEGCDIERAMDVMYVPDDERPHLRELMAGRV